MSRRSDKVLMVCSGLALVAALIYLPDWQALKHEAVRIAHWQIYGR